MASRDSPATRSPVPQYTKHEDPQSPTGYDSPELAHKAPLIDDGLIPQPNQNEEGHKIALDAEYRDSNAPQVTYAPYYASSSVMDRQSLPPPTISDAEKADGTPNQRRMRRIKIIAAVVIILVILGAVLGGVLGTQLHKKSSSSAGNSTEVPASALKAIDRSGLASVQRADGQGMLMYFQAPNGSVIETYYPNSALTGTGAQIDAGSQSLVPIKDMLLGSPMTALSYSVNNTQFIFYANTQLRIMQISAPGMDAVWGDSTQVSPPQDGMRLFSGSTALAACVSTRGSLKGVRLYFGAATRIQELSWNFGDRDVTAMWKPQMFFNNSDPESGVACSVIQAGSGQTYLNLYYRNKTNTDMAHSYYTYTNDNKGTAWKIISESQITGSTNFHFGGRQPLTAVLDDAGTTQYVFYGGDDSQLKMATSDVTNGPTAAGGSFYTFGPVDTPRLTSYFVDGAPLVVNQYNSSTLRTTRVARAGSVLGNSTLVG